MDRRKINWLDQAWQSQNQRVLNGYQTDKRMGDLNPRRNQEHDFIIAEVFFLASVKAIVAGNLRVGLDQARVGLRRIQRSLERGDLSLGYRPQYTRQRQHFLIGAFQWMLEDAFGHEECFSRASTIVRKHLREKPWKTSERKDFREFLFYLLAYDLCLLQPKKVVADYTALLPMSEQKDTFRIPSPGQILSELPHFLSTTALAILDRRIEDIRPLVMRFYGKLLIPPARSKEPILLAYDITAEHYFFLSIVWGRVFQGLTRPIECLRSIRDLQILLMS